LTLCGYWPCFVDRHLCWISCGLLLYQLYYQWWSVHLKVKKQILVLQVNLKINKHDYSYKFVYLCYPAISENKTKQFFRGHVLATKDSLWSFSDSVRNLAWSSLSVFAAVTYIYWLANKKATWNGSKTKRLTSSSICKIVVPSWPLFPSHDRIRILFFRFRLFFYHTYKPQLPKCDLSWSICLPLALANDVLSFYT